MAPDVATTYAADQRSEAVSVVGYLAKGRSNEFRRVYKDLRFQKYLEIPVEAIVSRVSETGGNDLTQGRSVVWIQPQAVVQLCEQLRASSLERSRPGTIDWWPF